MYHAWSVQFMHEDVFHACVHVLSIELLFLAPSTKLYSKGVCKESRSSFWKCIVYCKFSRESLLSTENLSTEYSFIIMFISIRTFCGSYKKSI